jgi:cbb3-type cytochrome oxidase subunit 3
LKLKQQLYIFQAVLSLVLFLFLGFTYFAYEKQYKKDIDIQIQKEIALHKKEIFSSIDNATKKLHKQKKYFKSIHLYTLNILKENPNLDLPSLKEKLQKKYTLPYTDIELYLINKKYIT